jgi:NAD-dependent dihydropyrimidine dehydrogenase PreA subunit
MAVFQTNVDCKEEPGEIFPVVNFGKCEGKADCVAVCPENVFAIRRIEPDDFQFLGPLQKLKLRLHGMAVAYTPNADACRACGLCIAACPERAISLAGADG